jgi:capsular exopolysaccharide synthesis family protein
MALAPLSPELAATQTADDSNTLSIWNILSIIRQRLPVALAIFVLVVAATAAYVWTRTPRYTATARLLIETRGINLTDMSDAFDAARGNVAQRDIIQTQVQLITSTPVLKHVLATGLFSDDPAFTGSRDPVAKLSKLVKVAPAPSGYILDVSVTHVDPAKAAATVNAVIDAYRAENRARRANVNDDGIVELKKKSEDLRARLAVEEESLREFVTENGLGSFDDTKTAISDRFQTINKTLLATEPKRITAETQYKTAQAALDGDAPIETIPGVLESSIISSLKIELAKLQRQETDLASIYGDNHSQLKSVRTQIEAIQAQLRSEAGRIVDGLRGRYEQLQDEESALRAEFDVQNAEMLRFNDLATQYALRSQTRDSLQQAYNSIIRRIDELETSNLESQGESVFVVARAEVPNIRSWPNRPKMLAFGIFFGLLLGIGMCFLLDYLDTTIKSDSDVQTYVRRPLLGSVPSENSRGDGESADDFYVLEHPHSTFAEAFRTIRTCLSFSADHAVRSLVVSSTGPAEGKSICSVNLAIAYAQSGKRVLIVDADLRKPRLNKVFPDAPAIGLSDLLAGDSEFIAEDLISPTKISGLFFLSSGTIPPNPVALLDSARFAKLLAELTAAYDLVLFDTPPCLNMVDALVIAKQTDGLVYVLRSFATNKFATQQSVRQLETANVNVLGAILNDVDLQKSHYYYYYSSKYYHSYNSDDPVKKKKS